MSPAGRDWNEDSLSETPALEHLQRLGYTYLPPEQLDTGRASARDVVLTDRLARALQKLNPWLTENNRNSAVRAVAGLQAASLTEASEKLHTILTYGTTVEQDRGDGKKSHPVRFFDFDDPKNNDFVVTRQFRVQGTKKNIRPDLVLFVNGVPLVLIECKSPTLGEAWKLEALDQFSRYQEMEDRYRELGAPRLFQTLQILVATCGQAAVYGTVLTPHRFYVEWKEPYPQTLDNLAKVLGRAPNAQEILFEGMLAPANLLDLVRNFIVFERDENSGKTIRKLCRYQQFGAVNKALQRARTAKTPTGRGGVVWHTQGSGKSLTMLWLALKLRRDPLHENPTLVIVTDRKDLDEQISKTFVACGFPNPEQAESVRDLKRLLSGPTGKTVLTTVQKFQEIEGRGKAKGRRSQEEYPLLSEAKNIFVLADEAHRTQYGGLAANLRNALPNACFFGFTGTPIDKQDRSTLQTFGGYIDTYTIEQAVADGATVPIFYESRLADLRIVGNSLDALFDRVFADRTEEEREAIKKKFGREEAIARAPRRIELICLDLLEHYTQHIQPNGFKAQVVAVNRETAALYKETLDRLNGPPSACIISSSNKDEEILVRHHTTEEERKKLIKRFYKPGDPLSILVVCDMLLTGFDAPVEQVMYLDAPLKEHTLLQAIARVNRVFDKKTYGLIVDYWGVSEALTEALAIFASADVKGAMTPKGDELPRLQSRHQAVMRFFVRVKDKDVLEDCIAVLAPDDVRAEFEQSWKRFAQSLDMLLPDPRALPYVGDARWLGKIRSTAAAKYRDSKIDISDCGAKVRKLIEEAVIADGIQILVKQVSLFSPEFEEKLAALKSDEARASEMEHALKDEIHVKLEEDPAFYTSLRERLEQLIEDRKAKRIDAAEQLKLFEQMRKEARGRHEVAQKLGLSEAGLAIYGLIADPKPLVFEEPRGQPYGAMIDESKRELASLLEEQLGPQVAIVDWAHKDDVQREMRRLIKRQLKAAGFSRDKLDPTAASIVELMKRRKGPSSR